MIFRRLKFIFYPVAGAALLALGFVGWSAAQVWTGESSAPQISTGGSSTPQISTGDQLELDPVEIRLVSAVAGAGDLEELRLGLQFLMQPGWKIYWRSPGTAGFPPEADWSESANLSTVDMAWPAPSRFMIFGLESLGYKDEVVLPLTVRPQNPGQAVSLRAEVNYLTCKELCVPGNAVLALDIPEGPALATPQAGLIDRYRAQVPVDAATLGVEVEEAVLQPDTDGTMLLRLAVQSEQAFGKLDLFVEGPLAAFFEKPDIEISRDGRRAIAVLRGSGAEPNEMIAEPLLVTLVDGDRAMEQPAPGSLVDAFPELPAGYGAPPGSAATLWAIVGLALLGGLILNLMPCVLPVLSLKLLSVLGHGGRENTEVRIGFVASVAGILTSFMILASALAGLKAAGATVGWGIQFQQPVFLAIMVVVVILFACNLFGLFEIVMPYRLANLFASGAGPTEEHHHSLGGHFLTGAFAALLATPCSAPFLGTAVGFALSRGTSEIFIVFGALGLGLSAPYLLIAAFPGVATKMPRPGAWMVTMKRILGLLLVATGVWLVTVIASVAGTISAIAIAALASGIGVLLWLRPMEGLHLNRYGGKIAAVLAAAIVVTPLLAPAGGDPATQRVVDDTVWRPFDEAEIHRLVADGQTVLVDVTADWCITCQVNKAAVLNRDPLATLLADGRIVAMRADWTQPSQRIADYLASFGRYGIPFNAVYGPDVPDGVMLPEILVTDSVLAAVEKAGGAGAVALR